MIRIPRFQTSLAGIFIAVFILSVLLMFVVNHAGHTDARCKIVFCGEIGKVGVRGPVQIDVENDSYCALIVEDSFRPNSEFPLQIGLTEEQAVSLSEKVPLNTWFVVHYRPGSWFGLPADNAHDAVVSYLRKHEPTIKYRPR